MWGFVARKVNKRDGSTAYKLINHADSVKEVPADDIYFVLEMNDYNYTHWAEMASRYGLQESKGGLRIMKVPTNTVKENPVRPYTQRISRLTKEGIAHRVCDAPPLSGAPT